MRAGGYHAAHAKRRELRHGAVDRCGNGLLLFTCLCRGEFLLQLRDSFVDVGFVADGAAFEFGRQVLVALGVSL